MESDWKANKYSTLEKSDLEPTLIPHVVVVVHPQDMRTEQSPSRLQPLSMKAQPRNWYEVWRKKTNAWKLFLLKKKWTLGLPPAWPKTVCVYMKNFANSTTRIRKNTSSECAFSKVSHPWDYTGLRTPVNPWIHRSNLHAALDTVSRLECITSTYKYCPRNLTWQHCQRIVWVDGRIEPLPLCLF